MKENGKKHASVFYWSGVTAVCLVVLVCALWLIFQLTRQIPVYTGMTVSNSGQVIRSHATVPTEEEKALAENVRDLLFITGSKDTRYYANPDADVLVTVHIDNPDRLKIRSLSLNGKEYSSEQFEDGSDAENLILKLNVGDTEGMIEYTLDAIHYIGGIKSGEVPLEGDRTVGIGISAAKQPTLSDFSETEDVTVGISDVALRLTVTDKLSLIEQSNGAVAIALCDWDVEKNAPRELIGYQPLTVGKDENATFVTLSPNRSYAYYVLAYYDTLDGTGVSPYVLYRGVFKTEYALRQDSFTVGQSRVDFDLIWNEGSQTKELQSLRLYAGDTLVRELETDATCADGLRSGCAYRLVATYQYGRKTETEEYFFRTATKKKPTYAISVGTVTETSLMFDVSSVDIDHIGRISKIELLHATEAVRVAQNANIRAFSGLLAGNEYIVRITYEYDLNDGNGIRTETVEKIIRTEGNVALP